MKKFISTGRLSLRPIAADDAQYIYDNWACDLEVCKYMTWTPHKDIEETHGFVKRCLDKMGSGEMTWLIVQKESEKVIGCFDARRDAHKVDVGYLLLPKYWGQGYMTEVMKSVIKACFALDGVYRVAAVCDVDNMGSRRVMEKAGMSYEGLLKSWLIHPNMSSLPRDCHCLSIIKDIKAG